MDCKSCKFSVPANADNQRFCKRNPPVAPNGVGGGMWPIVVNNDWCGEWKPTDENREIMARLDKMAARKEGE